MSGSRRCVFFDRDGVVNASPGEGYVLSPDAFHLNPGIAEALRLLRERDCLAIVVTSQKGVGKGLMTGETLTNIHDHMRDLLAAEGAAFDAVYAHTGTGGPADFPAKPDPGMILAAAERFAIDLRRSWIIGDADRDIAMGDAAGLAGTIRILGEKTVTVPATHTLENTTEIPGLLRIIL
jgi:histidinol-phosphate phosphatase family protein